MRVLLEQFIGLIIIEVLVRASNVKVDIDMWMHAHTNALTRVETNRTRQSSGIELQPPFVDRT